MTIKSTIFTVIIMVLAVISILISASRFVRADDGDKGRADDATKVHAMPLEWSAIELVYFCNLPLAEAKIENCSQREQVAKQIGRAHV